MAARQASEWGSRKAEMIVSAFIFSGFPLLKSAHPSFLMMAFNALKCRAGNCLYGRLYDDNDVDSGKCPDCDGGMMFEGANQ